jgi:dTDP-4-amino-4,6-dideoxygalactose transaminase
MLSCYKALGFEINDYPNAFNMYKNEISLPLFFDLTLDEVDIVCKAVVESVEEVLGKC